MIDSITSILNQGLSYAIPMIVLLGLLIFVHELGHFIAAKFFNVRVETFSLGFGPKILKFIKDETVYCISAFPLGGYVKMYGDEPGKDIPLDLQNKSYLHKPVGQRIIIALAGPLMNLFFAGLLFYVIALIGDKALTPKVGEIATNSEAYQAGFRDYDEINSINNQNVETWDQIKEIIEANQNKNLKFSITRGEEKLTLSATPELSSNDNLFSTADNIGKINGLHSNIHLPIVGIDYNSALYKAGLRSGDNIVEINNEKISWYYEIETKLKKSLNLKIESFPIKIQRFADFRDKNSFKEFTINLKSIDLDSQNFGLFVPETQIAEVQKESPAEKSGLLKGDRILKINNNLIYSFNDIVKNVSNYSSKAMPLNIEILRDDKVQTFQIIPNMNSLEGQFGETEERFTIGVVPTLFALPQTFIWKSKTFVGSIKRAFFETVHWTKVTLLSFVRILQNRVSSKNISGIISIGQVAQQSWNIGLNAFLKMMAIISINLFIINLLPIPILDGGHLLLFSLEAIKGAPISLKKIEVAQQIGFLIILFLMAFALFNDFSRIFGS
jgi:regulator of sigma E protease